MCYLEIKIKQGRETGNARCWEGRGCLLNKVVMEALSQEVKSEQRPEEECTDLWKELSKER